MVQTTSQGVDVVKLITAVSKNTFLVAQTADSSAVLITEVLETRQTLRTTLESKAGQTLDQALIDDLVGQLESTNSNLQQVLVNQQKISETAAQTSPITPSPDAPIPPTDATPVINPEVDDIGAGSDVVVDTLPELPTDSESLPIEITPTGDDIGLPGSVSIDPVSEDTFGDSEGEGDFLTSEE